ncbi:MAG: hypothetical protein ACKOPB_06505 [Actinomycetota bacterium]
MIWPILILLVIAAQLIAMKRETFGANILAAILGLLISVLLLGVSRAREARLRADGRFTDWGLVGAGSFMNLATLGSWALGVANVFFVAKELTR